MHQRNGGLSADHFIPTSEAKLSFDSFAVILYTLPIKMWQTIYFPNDTLGHLENKKISLMLLGQNQRINISFPLKMQSLLLIFFFHWLRFWVVQERKIYFLKNSLIIILLKTWFLCTDAIPLVITAPTEPVQYPPIL